MLAGAAKHSRRDRVAVRAAGNQTGFKAQFLAAVARKTVKAVVGAAQQGDILRTLEVGQADHAATAMRGAEIVRRIEAVDAEHALAAAGERLEGARAHRTEADHDHIKGTRSHRRSRD